MLKPLALRALAPVKDAFALLPARWRPALGLTAVAAAMMATVGAAYVGGEAAQKAGPDPAAVVVTDEPGFTTTSAIQTVEKTDRAAKAASARELNCLTQAVYYEARGEGRAGMEAVAQVVLNRAKHPAYPKTVCGVVFQGSARRTGCQFSFTCNGAMKARVNRGAWNRAKAVATRAMDGHVAGGIGKATHFHTTAVAPVWRNSLIRVGQVGDHVFYRFGRPGVTYSYASQRARAAEAPALIQADLSSPVRDADAGPIAYSTLISSDASAETPTAAPAAKVETITPVPTA